MAVAKVLTDQIVSHFPQKNLRFIFAYGSGMFQQHGQVDMSKNMLDLVFAVDDPALWHQENLRNNPKHYSFLRHLGLKNITYIQDGMGARVYYNTLVQCEGRLVKYGVIKTASLINDLLDWETLYVSGRLHKPVNILRLSAVDSDISQALTTNLQSAIHAALLLLPEQFTEEELYLTIASLSYTGDFRMMVGEDRNKVRNIVKPNIELFRKLYAPLLDNEETLHWNKSAGFIEQSLSPVSQYHHLNLLPKSLMFGLVNLRNFDGRHRDTEEVLRSLAKDIDCPDIIRKCLSNIVWNSSLRQSVKGILTAGLLKTIRYSWSKLKKMWKS